MNKTISFWQLRPPPFFAVFNLQYDQNDVLMYLKMLKLHLKKVLLHEHILIR